MCESADGLYICIFSSSACAAFALGFPITAFLMARSAAFVCVVDASIDVETKNEGVKHGIWEVVEGYSDQSLFTPNILIP